MMPFSVMAKATGPICNLDCAYCFYLEKEKLYPAEHSWRMPEPVLDAFIRQTIESQDRQVVSFAWQGGEPTLLGVDYFERVVELQSRYAGGRRITNALQTNGIALDDAWCSFFRRNNFLIGLSIDGPRKLHDRYRRDKGGKGSFDRVLAGLECLKKHGVDFNTLTVVHRENALDPLETYRFLKETGSRFMQFIPLVERQTADAHALAAPGCETAATVTEWSVRPLDYGKFLSSIFDEWVRHDVGTIFVQHFDVALERWMNIPPSLCVFGETCGDAPIVEHNGDVYACDHYVYNRHRLGNIMERPLGELVGLPAQRTFGQEKKNALPARCLSCDVLFACNGECPKHRFPASPDGESGVNYLCEGYRHFFHHIDFAMRFMREQLQNRRAPALIMEWIREAEENPPQRNDACWCGSDKKFKLCHGR